MRFLLKKLFPARIRSLVYYLPENANRERLPPTFAIKVFTNAEKSGIQKIDDKLSSNNTCYACLINNEIVHTTWLFKNKLLTKQLVEKNVFTAGDSHTEDKFKGMGIYPYVLKYISRTVKTPILIYVAENNIASIKGIEKAGFKKKYSFSMIRIFGIKVWCKKYAVND